jgi:Spy/CpxP family protein refolding chaperone
MKLTLLPIIGAFWLLSTSWMLAQGVEKFRHQSIETARVELKHVHEEGPTGSGVLKEVLGLSDSQIQQIEQDNYFFQQKIQPLCEQISQLEEKIRAAEEAGDLEALNQGVRQRPLILKQMDEEWAARSSRIFALMTADQRAKVNQLKETLRSAEIALQVMTALGLEAEGGMGRHFRLKGPATIVHEK